MASDEEVEAGAEAGYQQRVLEIAREGTDVVLYQPWATLHETGKNHEREIARACLEAAERVRARLH
jgi:hypothetical protein